MIHSSSLSTSWIWSFTWISFFLFLFHLLTSPLLAIEGRSSYPYLSGYTWGHFCDWRLIDKDYCSNPESFNPTDVKLGDTIFLDFSKAEEFARDFLPRIHHKIILVSANYGFSADMDKPGRFAYLLDDDRIAAWFIQNIDQNSSSKLIPIPIGLASNHWLHGNTDLFDRFIPNALQRTSRSRLMYLNFTFRPERIQCLEYFQKIGADILCNSKPFNEYLIDLCDSTFVVSPQGNGLDTHRTWEALLLGCYPIVKSSHLDPLFEGLPVVIVNEWSEVTGEFLSNKEKELNSKAWSREKLYAAYWLQKVKDLQHTLRFGSIQK